jgi:hypothetical protein
MKYMIVELAKHLGCPPSASADAAWRRRRGSTASALAYRRGRRNLLRIACKLRVEKLKAQCDGLFVTAGSMSLEHIGVIFFF